MTTPPPAIRRSSPNMAVVVKKDLTLGGGGQTIKETVFLIPFKRLSDKAATPAYQTPGSAGFDFHAAEEVILLPSETRAIKTGLAMQVMEGTELQVRNRSGLSLKTTLEIFLGTIDSSYRGEICIMAHNRGPGNYKIHVGDRIAQGIVAPIICPMPIEVLELSQTERGESGFGSTGSGKEK